VALNIKTTDNDKGKTLLIRADETLDCETHTVFSNAALVASYPWINEIEIDLGNTTLIRDSGLSMLLMLMNKTGMRRRQIRLTNCRPEIRTRLTTSPVADLLYLA
jgi:anti-anti-sigma regulatory factor